MTIRDRDSSGYGQVGVELCDTHPSEESETANSTIDPENRMQIRLLLGSESSQNVCANARRATPMCIFLVLLVGVGIGATSYAGHCAKVLANTSHSDVRWYPQLAFIVAMFGVLSQVALFTITFRLCLQRPILQRYALFGVVKSGRVVDRLMRIQETENRRGRQRQQRKFHKLVVAYVPNETEQDVFAKEFSVKEEEFGLEDVQLRVLPDKPTSAIREKDYVELCGSRCNGVLIALIAPSLWLLVGLYSLDSLPADDFWRKQGLWLLFGGSVLCSLCGGYFVVSSKNHEILDGGACRIPARLLPPGFLGLDANERQEGQDLEERRKEEEEIDANHSATRELV